MPRCGRSSEVRFPLRAQESIGPRQTRGPVHVRSADGEHVMGSPPRGMVLTNSFVDRPNFHLRRTGVELPQTASPESSVTIHASAAPGSSISSRWWTHCGPGQTPDLPAQGIDYRNRSMHSSAGAWDAPLLSAVTPTPTTCGSGPPGSARHLCRNGTTSRTQPGCRRSRSDSPIH